MAARWLIAHTIHYLIISSLRTLHSITGILTFFQPQKVDGEADGGEKKDVQANGEADQTPKQLSKKQKKLQKRLSIAVLKQLVIRPEIVEVHFFYYSLLHL